MDAEAIFVRGLWSVEMAVAAVGLILFAWFAFDERKRF